MAKRYTDTDKWKKPFIRALQTPYKLLWFYILDDCNHAGIWEVDLEVAQIRTGEKFTENEALEMFGDRILKITKTKWFIPDFLLFQYPDFPNQKNRVHSSIIQVLSKYQIEGLISPLKGVKDKDKDKDIVFSVEECIEISLKDEKWVRENKTNRSELERFNAELRGTGETERNPKDYKRHFYYWKKNGKLQTIESGKMNKNSYV